MRKYFRFIISQPMRLLLTIVFTFLFYQFIPMEVRSGFLSISLTLKELLMFMIPFIIFSSVYTAFSKIRGRALYFVILLLGTIVLSNFTSVSIAGLFGYLFLFGNQTALHSLHEVVGLAPLWQFSIPKLISNNIVLTVSLVLACVNIPVIEKNTSKLAKVVSKIVDVFLKKLFIPLLPIFIFGFLLKLLTDDIIGDVLAVNPKAFLFMILTLISYLLLIFMAAVFFYKKKAGDLARNLMAPSVTAFTCMSSAAALPFSIKAAEANTGNKNVSDVVIPATVNIHMIGDSICIPILAMILMAAFGLQAPSLEAYLIFAGMFVVTKFSGAAVPGGSILIMIPILEGYLGFTPEMTALITICYIFLDPICSCGNVIGNNLFVIHFDKLYGRILRILKKA